MKSRARIASCLVAFGFAAVAPFVTGCAEEEAEGPEAAYPVGASTGPQPRTPPPPVSAPAPPQQAAESPQASPSYAGSGEVAVGDDSETPEVPAGDYADSDPSALTDFHSTLDPYGTWEEDSTYGTVWVPSPDVVGADFVPYETAGHWGYEDDYVWVSDYGWGWAPFHYGRWAYVGGIGWEWIPGRRYAGAWVSWRYGWDDWAYVGWAPLPPTWCWHGGLAVGLGFVPVAPYAFVATGDLFARHVATRVVVGDRVGLVAAHTRPWVPASPTVAGHVIAQPAVGGPPPSVMHIPASGVVGAGSNQGVAQARAFARPNAAATAGYSRIGASPAFSSGSRSVAPASYPRSAGVAPAYGPPAPSHFGGRLGAGFSGRGVTSAWSPARSASMTAVPSAAQVARPTFASPALPRGPAPTFHPVGRAPSVAAAPAFHGFSTGTATGGFHGGGGYSGGFHGSSGFSGGGSHGGGGFHGGGGGHGGGHR